MNQTAPATRTYVIFRLGSEHYGVPIASVNSIIRYEDPTPVPRAPDALIGVINIRGRIVPVVDLSKRFGKGTFVASAAARIVVAEVKAGPVGIAVDAANEVTSLPSSDIAPVPESILTSETVRAFEGVVQRNGRLVILLNIDQAIPQSEYSSNAGESGFGEGDRNA